MDKKQLHHKYCDECFKFQVGVCGGIQYHIDGLVEQPLCDIVKKEYEKLQKEKSK